MVLEEESSEDDEVMNRRILKNIHLFIYFVCTWSSSLCGLSLVVVSGGYPRVVVCALLIVAASLVADCRLQTGRLR